MYKSKFEHLKRRLTAEREKAIHAANKVRETFYIELTKELYQSNKLDCSRDSDKCRRKRVSYMANKQRQ